MVESDRQIRVRLANGQLVPASRVAHTAAMGVGEYYFGDHLFIVLDELVEYDVVLGRSFLNQSGAVVDHGNDRITFGRAKSLVGGKLRKLAPKGNYAVFCALVADLVAGRSEIEQDSLLQLLGLRATPGSSQSAGTSAPVDSALHGRVMQVVKQYEDAMRPLEGKLPPSRGQFDHSIELINDQIRPRSRRAIPLSNRHQQALGKELARLLDAGHIRVSRSEWAAPVFFVPKNEHEDRMVVDYRALNSVTRTNSSSLPYAKELFARLNGCVLFTKLDLRSGYHQLRMKEEDICRTAFITPHGHFEWVVMPFGEKNAPASFAQLMSQLVLKGLVHTFVLVFQDDLLIASKRDEDHVDHVKQVLDRLAEHGLWISPEKCQWAVRDTEFLGHRIRATDAGTVIEPLQSKVDAVMDWPTPVSTGDVRAFHGLANFYRGFVPEFSKIAAPLTDLTRKGVKFVWNEEHEAAFLSLKRAMCDSSALLTVNEEKPFYLHVDASCFAVGASLSQKDDNGVLRPVAFFSRKLSDIQLRWDVYEREIYSVVAALEQWQMYLRGTSVPIQIFTDHQSLEQLSQQLLTPKQSRWLAFMSDFRFVINWIPADGNGAADALSRRPDWDSG
jgi:hypothetical protein